jgi:esterase
LVKCFSNFSCRELTTQNSSEPNVVELSHELYDRHHSENAIIIAHGLFGSKLNWRSVAKRLNTQIKQKVKFDFFIFEIYLNLIFKSRKVQVYTVDMRNHGFSEPYVDSMTYSDMANDLKNFIEKIVLARDKSKKITLIGHSMGGKASMTLALKNVNI